MVAIRFIAADGSEQTIDATCGISLMENAIANGIEGIVALCGGNAYCGTCRVHVEPDWRAVTGLVTEMEEPMIEASGDTHPGVRLSCQIEVSPALEGLVVRTPESQE
ncbi:2Fe-2S iron-sulfur cluster-binding protein [Novosphingobium album (ex Hu et al. 2023)]|uniref:(2Fe-2S)-binding protein n=1 Tax=Novosphingobium album (ex Hu et al. 2023) TaxID=2930093 RepID=A0ABT0AXZ0_9SPHN|nr:2Fe-2S iron-sulfur cluster-binding protein [Novosphingobium album (ex Hu et al. 2023)]MCJ2177686.1 (2Fe-2S)-binding protein [Novosphingobium album (ex Hu et al. 2023)]